MEVIRWLAQYYTEMQVPDKAIALYERASHLRPNDAQWPLAVAACTQRIGNYHKALQLLKETHSRFPDNNECIFIFSRSLSCHFDIQSVYDVMLRF